MADSVVLYASPVWGPNAFKRKKNKAKLLKEQRKVAIRITRAYRTVETMAVIAIAGVVPWPRVISERTRLKQLPALGKKEAREETLREWQNEWCGKPADAPGSWTRHLIPDLVRWFGRKHGETTYYLTQVLTGHGCFQKYLHKIHKAPDPRCITCSTGEVDDVTHTVFVCPALEEARRRTPEIVSDARTVKGLIAAMLEDEKSWEQGIRLVGNVFTRKTELENERRRRASQLDMTTREEES